MYELSIQTRSDIGELNLFKSVVDFINYYHQNKKSIVKVSLDDFNGFRHRFTMRYSGGAFDLALYNKCKKIFPVGTLLFADIPLQYSDTNELKIARFCALNDVDYYYGYDCVNMKNAFNYYGFIEYLIEQETLFNVHNSKFCECSCCNSVVCPTCEPRNLHTVEHLAPCGKTCYCYKCSCTQCEH
jgi:hypothetical protein